VVIVKKDKLTIGGFIFLFISLGLIFLLIEITFRALFDAGLGQIEGIKYCSFTGYTSLWMILIGGFTGISIGKINENEKIVAKIPFIIQCLMGTFIILFIELVSGILFNIILGMNLWDYSNNKYNLLGQISLSHAFVWFLLCPLGFWLDDQIRNYLFGKQKKYSIKESYLKIFK
jgi:uncharacterized membrane protein